MVNTETAIRRSRISNGKPALHGPQSIGRWWPMELPKREICSHCVVTGARLQNF